MTVLTTPEHRRALVHVNVRQAKLIGYRRLARRPPAVVLPVFADIVRSADNLFCYQRISNVGRVEQLIGDPDLQIGELFAVNSELGEQRVICLGDLAIYAYELSADELILGT